MDIILQNALLDKTMHVVNIGIEHGVISKISKEAIGQAKQTFDAQGRLVVPPFFESHFHLDNTLLWGDVNKSGTLREAIELYASRKRSMDIEDIVARASETLRMCLANGVTWVRSHVDIDDIGQLNLLEGVKAAKEKFAGIVDVQIIAFPQQGMVRDPETIDLMYAAMESGADIVGGIPHFERDMDAAARHIEIAFEIAKKYDADIDMHVDEVDDPNWYSVELLAEKTIAENYQGRVAAGHCCSMAAWGEDKFQRIIPKIKEADLNIITNVLTNLVGQGRGDKPPARRGVPPLNKLIQAGINIASGTDDMLNMFYPFGNMNPLEAINFAAHAGYLTTPELIDAAFDMPLYNAAKTFRIEEYGIQEGNPADLCLLPVTTKVDAIRMHPAPSLVMRDGNVLVQTEISQKFANAVPHA
jgi:cytosine/creatinine deaminase